MYPRCLRPRCQDPPFKKGKAQTYGQNNLEFEQKTGSTNKDGKHLYSELALQHSFNKQHQVPNNLPVPKRHKNETLESEGDCKNNHYQASKIDFVMQTNHYQKPKDTGGELRHVYENFGKHDDQTDV